MPAKNYDPARITCSIAGVSLHGYASGDDVIRLVPEADEFGDEIGVDGEVVRYNSNDHRALLTVKLMPTSDSNDFLTALSFTDRNVPNGSGVGAFLLQDNDGRAIYSAPECWIKRRPDVVYGATPQAREWQIRIANLQPFDGGS